MKGQSLAKEGKPNIVIVLSDQHNGLYTGFGEEKRAQTPFLEELSQTSTVFSRAYCNAPLCVPSRCSFLTGRLPHELEIYDNDDLLPENVPTIAHAMTLAGYETTLVGRMHFKGQDQRHGFERRLVGDITTQFWGTQRTDLGDFYGTLQAVGCQNAAGYGPSPVQEYDEAVVEAACEELLKDRKRPLFLVVGLYAPHFPYVAPEEEFSQSIDCGEDVSDILWKADSCYQTLVQQTTPQRIRTIRAAYRGMIKRLDHQLCRIYEAYRLGCKGRNVFMYLSDHGDQLGKRGIFGKKTMYEDSIRVPLIVEDGVHGKGEVREAVSLIDVTRTLLDYAGAQLPGCRGVNLFETNRPPVEAEAMTDDGTGFVKAVIWKDKKLLHMPQEDRLCIWDRDKKEEMDFSSQYTDEYAWLKTFLPAPLAQQEYLERYQMYRVGTRLIKAWGKQRREREFARFALSEAYVRRPELYQGMDEANGGKST